jgi:hypothetical protein
MDTALRNELIVQIVQTIQRLRLTTPAIMILEANKPFSFIASQFLLMAEPALTFFLNSDRPHQYALLLEDRANVELLLRRLEAESPIAPA